jgi:hypothetical protein
VLRPFLCSSSSAILGGPLCSHTASPCVAGRRARKETDRVCSDEIGGRDGKAERENVKN